jgi:uncharacterized cupredoxin-like copper-binding protein
MSRKLPLMLVAAGILLAGTGTAVLGAPTVIDVMLTDPGANTPIGTGMHMGHPDADMSKVLLKLTASPAVVPAGEVTFNVSNSEASLPHEMVIAKILDAVSAPPYDPARGKVNEDDIAMLGEVEELAPGGAGSLTLNMEPGTYLLFCNLKGHYTAGMWTVITVQ